MPKKQSLLDKALNGRPSRKGKRAYTAEEKELVLAWVLDEISMSQVARALDQKNTGNIYIFLAFVCKEIIKEKMK